MAETAADVLVTALRARRAWVAHREPGRLRPLPPKITREQAMHIAEALARGEPNGLDVIKTALGARIRELV